MLSVNCTATQMTAMHTNETRIQYMPGYVWTVSHTPARMVPGLLGLLHTRLVFLKFPVIASTSAIPSMMASHLYQNHFVT